MAFFLSKTLGVLALPSSLLLIALVAGAALLFGRWRRAGLWLVGLAAAAAAAAAVLPLGPWLMRPLEERFPQIVDLPAEVDGIVVLGGSFRLGLTADRGQVSLNWTAERVTAFVALARRYPTARLIFTGGVGSLRARPLTEADAARRLFADLGLDTARILFEGRSRNTHENALFAKELAGPEAGEVWLLITSANHMPRAVGSFRKVGFTVTPHPVDYSTTQAGAVDWTPQLGKGLIWLDRTAHEWYGLVVYRLYGWTDELFPGPG